MDELTPEQKQYLIDHTSKDNTYDFSQPKYDPADILLNHNFPVLLSNEERFSCAVQVGFYLRTVPKHKYASVLIHLPEFLTHLGHVHTFILLKQQALYTLDEIRERTKE